MIKRIPCTTWTTTVELAFARAAFRRALGLVVTLLGGCAHLPAPVVCPSVSGPAMVALESAVGYWARAGVPVRIADPGEVCPIAVQPDGADTCRDEAYACANSRTGIHYREDTPEELMPMVLAHELGHLLGAEHTDDPTAWVMVTQWSTEQGREWSARITAGECPSAADLAALEPIYGELGCE